MCGVVTTKRIHTRILVYFLVFGSISTNSPSLSSTLTFRVKYSIGVKIMETIPYNLASEE